MLFTTAYFVLASLAGCAVAKTAAGSGDFAVTINGVTYNPAAGKSADVRATTCTGAIKVRGVHVGYDIDCATLAVTDYTLTGAPDALRRLSSTESKQG